MDYMCMLGVTVPANIKIKRCSISSVRPSLGQHITNTIEEKPS